jgi:hypothetical protein
VTPVTPSVNLFGRPVDNVGMSVGGVSGSGSADSFLRSPGVRLTQAQGAALSSLFGSTTSRARGLESFTAAAGALPLYQRAGLAHGLTQWDGSLTPGSQRTASAAPTRPARAPMFTFNPFDRASWWTDPKGSKVDLTA